MCQSIQENLTRIRENIAHVCEEVGRNPDSVTILAATKTVPPERINCLHAYNIQLVGENRVQEFLTKVDAVENLTWHFIGSLQTNKVKHIIGRVALIHSVDRMSLADEIERLSAKSGVVTDVLIEINAGDEESKSGIALEQLEALYHYIQNLPHVRVKGFMPVLPQNADEILYARMNGIFCDYNARDSRITELSMGMSGDYETAVRYGSTIVRLGSCIFGERNYQ